MQKGGVTMTQKEKRTYRFLCVFTVVLAVLSIYVFVFNMLIWHLPRADEVSAEQMYIFFTAPNAVPPAGLVCKWLAEWLWAVKGFGDHILFPLLCLGFVFVCRRVFGNAGQACKTVQKWFAALCGAYILSLIWSVGLVPALFEKIHGETPYYFLEAAAYPLILLCSVGCLAALIRLKKAYAVQKNHAPQAEKP